MKKSILLVVAVLLLAFMTPVWGMAEEKTEWNLEETWLRNEEEIEWLSVSPNGTYLLGYDDAADERENCLVLYHVPDHELRIVEWKITEEHEGYPELQHVLMSTNKLRSMEIVWSDDERYFTFADYTTFVNAASGGNILCLGSTEACSLDAPFVWGRRRFTQGSGVVVNASFLPDSSALFLTLFNMGVYDQAAVILRYDLNTGDLVPWCPAEGEDGEGRAEQYLGRNMVAVSDDLILMSESRYGSLVIASKENGEWKYKHSLGAQDESHHAVQKLQFSRETRKGILLCRDLGTREQVYALYSFSLDEQGQISALAPLEGRQVLNAVLAPSGHAALIQYYTDDASDYLAMLDLEEMDTQRVVLPEGLRERKVMRELYFNTELSRCVNGYYWGGTFLLAPFREQALYALENEAAELICRNGYYQPPEPIGNAGTPVGLYEMNHYLRHGEEIPLTKGEVEWMTVRLAEDQSVLMEGYLYGELSMNGRWYFDGDEPHIEVENGYGTVSFDVDFYEEYTGLYMEIDREVYLLQRVGN